MLTTSIGPVSLTTSVIASECVNLKDENSTFRVLYGYGKNLRYEIVELMVYGKYR